MSSPFAALVRLQLRRLSIYLAVIIGLHSFDLINWLATDAIDERLIDHTIDYYQHSHAVSWVIFHGLLGFSIAQGLLIGEIDNKTLAFLDALPTTRTQVFFASLLCAWVLLMSGPAVGVCAGFVMHHLAATSLDPSSHQALLWPPLLVYGIYSLHALAFGMALSFLRRFAWLVLGVAALTMNFGLDAWPSMDFISPTELIGLRLGPGGVIFPTAAILVHSVAAACWLGLSLWLFQGRGLAIAATLLALPRRRGGKAILLVTGLLVVATWAGLFYRIIEGDDDTKDEQADRAKPDGHYEEAFREFRPEVARTNAYRFVYPSTLRHRALAAIGKGDEVHAEVHALLGGPSIAPIEVNMMVRLKNHGFSGLADWRSTRISLIDLESEEEVLGTLAHETAHLYFEALSDSHATERHQSMRFFNEGAATWVAHEVRGDAQGRERSLARAALARKLADLKLDDLMNDNQVAATFDYDLVYPLGRAFVEATVAACGRPIVGKIWVRLKDKTYEKLQGEALFRALLTRHGCTLDDVANRWDRLLADALEQQDLAALAAPLRAQLEINDGEVVVTTPNATRCRFRKDSGTRQVRVRSVKEGVCSIPVQREWTTGFEVQLGRWAPPARAVIWGRWVRSEVD